jgi:glycosyltransferase involved in cell wall biosynthesis
VDMNFFHPVKSKCPYKKRLGLDPNKVTISIISRFDPIKNHINFLEAMNLVIRNYPQVQILIGQDPKVNLEKNNSSASRVKAQIDEYLNNHLRLKSKVKFTGYMEDIRRIYHATDILVNSSLYESLGISLIEASACGIPVVATNSGTEHRVVKDCETGFLVPIQEPKLLAPKISVLIRIPQIRKTFGLRARQHILKNFDVKIYAQKIEKIYKQLIKN